ncbi:unnamed protein product, partial [Callosobruchus maculatus]
MDLANEFKKLEEHFTKSVDAFNGRLKQAMNADKPEAPPRVHQVVVHLLLGLLSQHQDHKLAR